LIGTGLDVWELVEIYQDKVRERVLAEHIVSERQLHLAGECQETYTDEIARALEVNERSEVEWRRLSPSVIPPAEP